MQTIALDGQGLGNGEVAIDRDDLSVVEDQIRFLGRGGGWAKKEAELRESQQRRAPPDATAIIDGLLVEWPEAIRAHSRHIPLTEQPGQPADLTCLPCTVNRSLGAMDHSVPRYLDAEDFAGHQTISQRARHGESRWQRRALTGPAQQRCQARRSAGG